MSAAPPPGRLGVGVVGAGRVGASLASALRAAGHAVVGASGSSEASLDRIASLLPAVPVLDVPEVVRRAELVLLTVPDDELAGVTAGLAATGAWQAGQLVVHTAGRFGWRVLEPARAAGATRWRGLVQDDALDVQEWPMDRIGEPSPRPSPRGLCSARRKELARCPSRPTRVAVVASRQSKAKHVLSRPSSL